MTDRERLLALLKDFGLFIKEDKAPDGQELEEPYGKVIEGSRDGSTLVIAGERWTGKPGTVPTDREFVENPKVGGYYGFGCNFVFDKDGQFLEVDFWE